MGGLLDSYMRALELKERLGDLKYRQEQREREREMFNLNLERFKRQSQAEDFGFRQALAELGAIPGNQQVEDALTQDLGPAKDPRMRVTPPGGGDFYLPTQTERSDRALNTRLREYEGKELIDRSLDEAQKVPVPIPQKLRHLFGGAESWRVSRDKALDAIKWLRESSKRDVKAMHFPRGVFFYDNEDIADRLDQRGGTFAMELPDLAARENEFPAMPAHLERKAQTLARLAASKSGGFTNGRRESQEFKDAVQSKAQQLVERAARNGETLTQEAAMQKARVYYLAGDGKGAVERWEKIQDSDAYQQELQRQRDSLYEGFRKQRGPSASPKPQSSSSTARKAAPRKVGDEVTYQGRRHRIVKVYPNGDYDLELLP